MGARLNNLLFLLLLYWNVHCDDDSSFNEDDYKVYQGAWHSLESFVLTNQTVGNITIISGHQVKNERTLMRKFQFNNQKDGSSRGYIDGTSMLINLYDENKFNNILQLAFQIDAFNYVLHSNLK